MLAFSGWAYIHLSVVLCCVVFPLAGLAQDKARERAGDKADQGEKGAAEDNITPAIRKLRKYKLDLYARFEQGADKQVKAILNAGFTKELQAKWTEELVLKNDRGIPLAAVPVTMKVERLNGPARISYDQVTEESGWRLRELKLPDEKGYITKHLWSKDGKQLFVMVTSNQSTIYQIDAVTWTLEAKLTPIRRTTGKEPQDTPVGVQDFALCSEGLAILGGARDQHHYDLRATSWAPFLGPGEPPFSQNLDQAVFHRLLIVDPATLTVKKSWIMYGDKLAAHCDSVLLYVWRDPAMLYVIAAKNGELVNGIDLRRTIPDKLQSISSPAVPRPRTGGEYPLSQPFISGDGKWLLLTPTAYLRSPNVISRFRIDGHRLDYETVLHNLNFSQRSDVLPVAFGTDSKYLCLTGKGDQLGIVVHIEKLDEIKGVIGQIIPPLQGPPVVGMEAASKSIFLADPDYTRRVENELREITVLQSGSQVSLPVRSVVLGFNGSTERSGIMAYGSPSSYWIEGGKPAPNWPFETEKSTITFSKPAVPEDTTQPHGYRYVGKETSKGRIEYRWAIDWCEWLPDGEVFLAYSAANGDRRLRRFDAATMTETHQCSTKTAVTELLITGAGLIYGEAGGLRIRDLQTLNDLGRIDKFSNVAGDPSHKLLAGILTGDLVVLNGADQSIVARTSLQELYAQGIDSPQGDLGLAIFPSGDRLLLLGANAAILTVKDGKIGVEKTWKARIAAGSRPLITIDPSGRYCQVGSSLLDFSNLKDGRYDLGIRGQGRTQSRGYFRNGTIVSLAPFGPKGDAIVINYRLGQDKQQSDEPISFRGATMLVPHPKSMKRYLVDGVSEDGKKNRVFRDVTVP